MGVKFSREDLEIFSIADFAGRMAAMRAKVRPKLEALGEELGPLLMTNFKREFFAHTAKHMRRKVNPPDETWVALGPQSRGYKAYVYFAFCIGKAGTQARVVMKDESNMRPALGANLMANRKFLVKNASEWKGLADYTRRDKNYAPTKVDDLDAFATETGKRLQEVKSALFDVGLEIQARSSSLAQDVLQAFDRLYPFYECGLKEGVKFR
ncbi:MAG: DUF1054 domain-containing protein [Deltaproteobacteria bacterium]|nr:DUF1054 domain-containing protein [Deltaproteobacteria bacterium]